jgi:hypothetical protein
MELLWTFPVVVDVKMSKKGAFMDISDCSRCKGASSPIKEGYYLYKKIVHLTTPITKLFLYKKS